MSRETDDSLVSTLAQQGGITLFGKLGGRIFSFLFLIFVTRAVDPKVYGTFTLALAIVSFKQELFNFNLDQSVDYFLPKVLAENDNTMAADIIGFISQVILLGTSAGVVSLILIRGWIARFFDTPLLAPLLGVMAFVILFQSLLNVQEKIFSSLKKMEYRVLVSDVGFPILKLLFIVIFVILGYNKFGLTLGYLLALVVAFFFGVYLLWWQTSELQLSMQALIQPSFSQKKELFKYAFPLYLTGIVYAVSGQVSYLVLGFYLGPSEVAIYRVAYQLTVNLSLVNMAIAPIFKPMVSEVDDRSTLRNQYRLATRWVVLLTIPMATVLIVSPDIYLKLLFSSDYVPATVAVIPLAIGFLIHSFSGPESDLLEGRGHTQITLFNSIIMVALNTILLFVLVPPYGVLGAGIATGLALASLPALAVAEIQILESIHPFNKAQLKFLVAGVISGTVGVGFSRIISTDFVTALLLPAVILSFYFTFIYMSRGFSPQERRTVRLFYNKIRYLV